MYISIVFINISKEVVVRVLLNGRFLGKLEAFAVAKFRQSVHVFDQCHCTADKQIHAVRNFSVLLVLQQLELWARV